MEHKVENSVENYEYKNFYKVRQAELQAKDKNVTDDRAETPRKLTIYTKDYMQKLINTAESYGKRVPFYDDVICEKLCSSPNCGKEKSDPSVDNHKSEFQTQDIRLLYPSTCAPQINAVPAKKAKSVAQIFKEMVREAAAKPSAVVVTTSEPKEAIKLESPKKVTLLEVEMPEPVGYWGDFPSLCTLELSEEMLPRKDTAAKVGPKQIISEASASQDTANNSVQKEEVPDMNYWWDVPTYLRDIECPIPKPVMTEAVAGPSAGPSASAATDKSPTDDNKRIISWKEFCGWFKVIEHEMKPVKF